MQLDFSAINRITQDAPEATDAAEFKGQVEAPAEEREPAEAAPAAPQAVSETVPHELEMEADRQNMLLQNALRIQQEYTMHRATANLMQSDILHGLKQGEDIYSLFMQACACISTLLNDTLFFNQVEQDVLTIYGTGLLEPQPLNMQLKAAQQRLERLQAALSTAGNTDAAGNIKAAIKAHTALIEDIQKHIQ